MHIIGGLKQDDPRHWRNHFRICPDVVLNGARIDHVCEADDVAGFVVVVVYDGFKPKLDASGTRILERRIKGKVEIVEPKAERRVNG
jgi:hypothetical protein